MVKHISKKESGFNGIVYAMAYFLLCLVFSLVYLNIYSQEVVVVKETLSNGIQLSENFILTDTTYNTGDEYIERERSRLHVITVYDDSTETKTPRESAQVSGLASRYAEKVKNIFNMKNGNTPEDNTLAHLRAGTLNIESLIFYEAVYDSSGKVTKYVVYHCYFNTTNSYVNYDKSFITNLDDAKINGRALKGSTIVSTVSYHLAGANSLFDEIVNTAFPVKISTAVDIVTQANDELYQ